MRRKRKVLRAQKPDCGAGEIGMTGMEEKGELAHRLK